MLSQHSQKMKKTIIMLRFVIHPLQLINSLKESNKKKVKKEAKLQIKCRVLSTEYKVTG